MPAAVLGHLAALCTGRAGALAAATAGAAVVVLVFALLARPLRLTELGALLSGIRRRAARS
ncbi:hypothetical protein SHKM778_49730 [Streptomyces sp. KM77-8]|uniref:Uncharacterized protein n=1 Tax=Streptomyces haneummycinicus TaxID=3074435 RepID=A0AAT9HMA8_9ACTN